jgi:ABC-type lipoprotein release transport system permease subunit
MAWRNLWRNPRRTGLTLGAIAFASLLLIFMLSFQFGSYEAMINASVRIQTGHLKVMAEGYHDNRDMRRVVADPSAVATLLENDPDVAAYTFRATAFSLLSSADRTYGGLVVGVDPKQEAGVSNLESLIRKGGYLGEEETDGALVGRLLARNLDVGLGDELTVLGQGRDGSVAATVLTVGGIFSSGRDALDRSMIYMPLSYFQEVFFMRGAVHEVVIMADSLWAVSDLKHRLSEKIPVLDTGPDLVVMDWNDLMPGLMQAIKLDLIVGMIFWGILIIVVAFSILNTFLMAIFERTREFGVLMAIGTRPARLTRLLMIESLFMTFIGLGSGILLGCLVTLFFQSHGIDLGSANELLSQYGISGRIYPRLSVVTTLTGPALICAITLLTALYPALRVRRLTPVEAMRHV